MSDAPDSAMIEELKVGMLTFLTTMIQERAKACSLGEAIDQSLAWVRGMCNDLERTVKQDTNIKMTSEETSND